MQKLKIGIFMDDFYPSLNGVIEVMNNHAIRLIKKGHEVVVIVPKLDNKYKDNFPYKVIRVPSVKLGKIGYNMAIPSLDLKMEKQLISENFDIIHIHSPFIMGKLGTKIAEKIGIPCVGTMHTQFDKDIKKFTKSDTITKILMKDLMTTFNKCDMCWAVNSKVAEIFKNYGASTLPGVQLTGTDFVYNKDQLTACEIVNAEFGLKKDELVFLFVGRLTIVKNILFLIESLGELKKNGVKFKMLFVGPFEDKVAIEKKVIQCDLKDEIIFTGKIMDRKLLSNIYCRSKLFLFPSLYDTNSLVQKEAAAQKVPTVFIEGSATSFLVTDNKNGFLAPNDVKAYAARVEEVLADEKLYNKVSLGSYEDLYISWDDLIDNLISDYYKVIEEKVSV